MTATERAAKAEYDLALAGASSEDKQAAAAQVTEKMDLTALSVKKEDSQAAQPEATEDKESV